jgi:hypothetical protein
VSYSEFTLQKVRADFGLTFDGTQSLFASVAPVPISPELTGFYRNYLGLGLLMTNEKGKSEFLVSPMLAEVWLRTGRRVGIFSGVELNVDAAAGLSGVCDFLVGRASQQLYVEAPLLAVVEAKKDSIPDGIGQCAAEMVAIQKFNANAHADIDPVYGCVTTGTNWKFLRLQGRNLLLDLDEYTIQQPDRLLGVLLHIVGPTPPSPAV